MGAAEVTDGGRAGRRMTRRDDSADDSARWRRESSLKSGVVKVRGFL